MISKRCCFSVLACSFTVLCIGSGPPLYAYRYRHSFRHDAGRLRGRYLNLALKQDPKTTADKQHIPPVHLPTRYDTQVDAVADYIYSLVPKTPSYVHLCQALPNRKD